MDIPYISRLDVHVCAPLELTRVRYQSPVGPVLVFIDLSARKYPSIAPTALLSPISLPIATVRRSFSFPA